MKLAVTLRHIQCFVEVARCGTVTEAARRLNISQPAASRRLSELETLLDIKLFRRQNRKLMLNDEGRLFLRYAQTADVTLKQGLDALAGLEGAILPTVSVGALPTVAGTLIPKSVQEFRRSAPGVIVRVETGASKTLLKNLRSGDLDMVVGRMPVPDLMRGLHFEHLYLDRLGFVVQKQHPLLQLDTPTLNDIIAFPCIVPGKTAVIRPLVDTFFLSQALQLPRDRIESTSLAFCANYLAASEAVWIISKGVAEPLVEQGSHIFVEIDTATTIGSIGITTNFEAKLQPSALLFIDTLKSLSKQF